MGLALRESSKTPLVRIPAAGSGVPADQRAGARANPARRGRKLAIRGIGV
jgi:hypothetical protein